MLRERRADEQEERMNLNVDELTIVEGIVIQRRRGVSRSSCGGKDHGICIVES